MNTGTHCPCLCAVAGGYHLLATDEEGKVWGWGCCSSGLLGLGHDDFQNDPQKSTTLVDAVEIKAGRTRFIRNVMMETHRGLRPVDSNAGLIHWDEKLRSWNRRSCWGRRFGNEREAHVGAERNRDRKSVV